MPSPDHSWVKTKNYGRVPPFGSVQPSDLIGAVESAIATAQIKLDEIATLPEAPTFDNVIAPYERLNIEFDEVLNVYQTFTSSMANSVVQEAERDLEPKLAAFHDHIHQNKGFFQKLNLLVDSPQLTTEQQRLVLVLWTEFRLAGALLDDAAKARLSAINQLLAGHYTSFSQKLLKDEDTFLHLTDPADLAGLPADLINASVAPEGANSGANPGWRFSNTRSAVEPFLTSSVRRDLRERIFRAFVQRGANDNEANTYGVIADILKLRSERAQLFGFTSHVHWRLENTMAKTAATVERLLLDVWKPATARVADEVAKMQRIADAEGEGVRIEAWDYRFYLEKVRKAEYDLDMEEVKPYLRLEHLKQALFYCARRLFGLEFAPVVEAVPVWHADVEVWEVRRERALIGLWYFDPYARAGLKQSGAWMSELQAPSHIDHPRLALVTNNANFIPGCAPSWDDAVTLFHEFGHALHGLLSQAQYPSLAGTRVYVDYVEFPSQLLEHWLLVPEVLERFALNEEGNPIPQTLIDKIKASMRFGKGFDTVEYLASALVDFRLHLTPTDSINPAQLQEQLLQELGMPKEMVMRHAVSQFGHIWSGDQYSACYWSYLWSDSLTADAYEEFLTAGNAFDSQVARRLHDNVFSAGNTVDPQVGYRAFKGRDLDPGALLRKRGFT